MIDGTGSLSINGGEFFWGFLLLYRELMFFLEGF